MDDLAMPVQVDHEVEEGEGEDTEMKEADGKKKGEAEVKRPPKKEVKKIVDEALLCAFRYFDRTGAFAFPAISAHL